MPDTAWEGVPWEMRKARTAKLAAIAVRKMVAVPSIPDHCRLLAKNDRGLTTNISNSAKMANAAVAFR